jgi:hypothetical protein
MSNEENTTGNADDVLLNTGVDPEIGKPVRRGIRH